MRWIAKNVFARARVGEQHGYEGLASHGLELLALVLRELGEPHHGLLVAFEERPAIDSDPLPAGRLQDFVEGVLQRVIFRLEDDAVAQSVERRLVVHGDALGGPVQCPSPQRTGSRSRSLMAAPLPTRR